MRVAWELHEVLFLPAADKCKLVTCRSPQGGHGCLWGLYTCVYTGRVWECLVLVPFRRYWGDGCALRQWARGECMGDCGLLLPWGHHLPGLQELEHLSCMCQICRLQDVVKSKGRRGGRVLASWPLLPCGQCPQGDHDRSSSGQQCIPVITPWFQQPTALWNNFQCFLCCGRPWWTRGRYPLCPELRQVITASPSLTLPRNERQKLDIYEPGTVLETALFCTGRHKAFSR